MKKQLISILSNIGLTDHEAKVYLAAVSLGPTSVLQISRAAKIKRTTVYSVLESLKQKGCIVYETKKWKKYFRAVHPEQLEVVLDERREAFKKSIPELSALYNLPPHESSLVYYDGISAIKSLYTEVMAELRADDEYFVISDTDQWLSLDKPFTLKVAKQRAAIGLDMRLLVRDTPQARKFMKLEKMYGGPMKLLPKHVAFRSGLTLTPRKMILQSLVPPVGAIVIENKMVIELQREMFLLLWDSIQ